MLPGSAVTEEMLGEWIPSSDQPDKYLKELSFDEAQELPNVMIMGQSSESSLTELMKRSFASDVDVKFLPFPNGEKGVNAQVNVFAAVRANSDYASQAGDFFFRIFIIR